MTGCLNHGAFFEELDLVLARAADNALDAATDAGRDRLVTVGR